MLGCDAKNMRPTAKEVKTVPTPLCLKTTAPFRPVIAIKEPVALAPIQVKLISPKEGLMEQI